MKMPEKPLAPKKPVTQGVTCDEGDLLEFRSKSRSPESDGDAPKFVCKLCTETQEWADGCYTCTKCNFDCCSKCYAGEKLVVEGVTCPKGDVLRMRVPADGSGTYTCKLCQETQSLKFAFYSCYDSSCEHNVCPACFKGSKTVTSGITCD